MFVHCFSHSSSSTSRECTYTHTHLIIINALRQAAEPDGILCTQRCLKARQWNSSLQAAQECLQGSNQVGGIERTRFGRAGLCACLKEWVPHELSDML